MLDSPYSANPYRLDEYVPAVYKKVNQKVDRNATISLRQL